jgi:hypothetical protein
LNHALYVKLKPGPLDKGPEPGVHWLVWIVELAGERLRSPHGVTDSESSSFPGIVSEHDWSSESHASSDTV